MKNILFSEPMISLSFDDGREDFYRNVYPILKKYKLNVTLFVISGYVDGSWKQMLSGSQGACTIPQLKEMRDSGLVEIALHGDKHTTEQDDFKICYQKLKKWDLLDNEFGFSVPHSAKKETYLKDFYEKVCCDGCIYIRGGRSYKCNSIFAKATFLAYLLTKSSWFYRMFNDYNVIEDRLQPFNIPSIVIHNNDSPLIIQQFLENLDKNVWINFMFHSIVNDKENQSKSKWCWDINKFEFLCKYLTQQSKYQVLPIIRAIKWKKGEIG